MNNVTKITAGIAVSMAIIAPGIYASVSETDGLGTSWIGSPTIETVASPTSDTTSEGNFGSTGGAGGFGALSQSFEATSAGTLANIQLYLAGGAQTYDVELYDLGAYPASGYPATSSSYTPGDQTDLLTAGDSFTYNAGDGGAQNVAELTFSGTDSSVTLQAGELYALELDPTTSTTSYWVRGGVQTFTGQAYRMNQFSSGDMGAINGAIRDFGMAVTIESVPEPTSLALFGLGGLAGAFMIRRRNA